MEEVWRAVPADTQLFTVQAGLFKGTVHPQNQTYICFPLHVELSVHLECFWLS